MMMQRNPVSNAVFIRMSDDVKSNIGISFLTKSEYNSRKNHHDTTRNASEGFFS